MSKNISSLLMDSLELPHFNTLEELSDLTGLSTRLIYCLSMKTEKYYKHTTIPKRNGKLRNINIPSYTLHILQRWILINILNKIAPTNRAMAFRKGNKFGHKQNAFYHSHTLYGLSIDLEDFFPSITANKVYTVFSNIGYDKFASTILTNICTLDGELPQGSACSPAISNIVCHSLDKRLIGLCEKRSIRFTRYADDMYFSCDDKAILLKNISVIRKIVDDEGFIINERKVHFHTPSNKKQITGITVTATNKEDVCELKAPKEMKKKIRSEIFQCLMTGNYENKKHILGEISYVAFIEKENKTTYLERIKKYIAHTTNKIKIFPELIEQYNENLFFSDSVIAKYEDFSIEDDDEFMYYSDIFENRKEYLKKIGCKDICEYKTWPEIIVHENDESEVEAFPDSPLLSSV